MYMRIRRVRLCVMQHVPTKQRGDIYTYVFFNFAENVAKVITRRCI